MSHDSAEALFRLFSMVAALAANQAEAKIVMSKFAHVWPGSFWELVTSVQTPGYAGANSDPKNLEPGFQARQMGEKQLQKQQQ